MVAMERRHVGDTDLEVSAFSLGTMTFGVETDEPEAHRQLDHFAAAGGTLVDTADVYGAGASEEIVGRWLAGDRDRDRDDIVLATKGRFPAGNDPAASGAGREHLTNALAASLRRLSVHGVDIYFVHGWDSAVPVLETLETLDGFVSDGLALHVGWSNVTGWQLQRILRVAEANGLTAPITLQPQYNLLDRGIEWELLPQCLEERLGVMPWSPLGGGWLTGKYRRDDRPSGATRLGEDPDRGVEAYDLRNTERTWEILDAVDAVAQQTRATPAAVALAWLRDRPGVASVILGARTVAQLEGNLDAAALVLDESSTALLTQVSAPGIPPYPYGFVQDHCDVSHWARLGTAAPAPG
jgi:aryl-alcohol dehydrogenase-like predicted oxidoreductase